MTQLLTVHPTHPQPRLIRVAATDAAQRRRHRVSDRFELRAGLRTRRRRRCAAHPRVPRPRRAPSPDARVPRSRADVGRFARIDNWQFRIGAAGYAGQLHVPAARRRARCRGASSIRSAARSACACPTIAIVQALLPELDEPILSSTLILPGDEQPLNDAADDRSASGGIDRRDHRRRTVSPQRRRRSSTSPCSPPVDRAPRTRRSRAPGPCSREPADAPGRS